MAEDPSRRSYHSPRRVAAARETRGAVLEAAGREFTRSGYVATSLAAIARAGGVSLATVKLVEPTKARLLIAAIEALVRSDDVTIRLVEQSAWQALLGEPDPRRMLTELGTLVATTIERQVDLLFVVWQAAPAEPEIAALERQASSGRWSDLRTVAEALAACQALRPELDVEAATDVLWALASPQAFDLLVRRRGWDSERWGRWLGDTLVRSLLGDGGRD